MAWVSAVPLAAVATLCACALLEAGSSPPPGPAARWVFAPAHVEGGRVKDQAGSSDASVSGPLRFGAAGALEALLIDADGEVRLPYRPGAPYLPARDLSVEAWVAVEKTVEWGGIAGAVQDNGEAEKGWILGFRQSSFSFGLASRGGDDGDGRLTYLRSRSSLEWGRWYHVAGTYDGTTQSLYVDGRLEAASGGQSGEILYPAAARFLIGAFADDDEDFRPRLWIRELRIYGHALRASEIQRSFAAGRRLLPELLDLELPPVVERLDARTFEIRYETREEIPSVVAWGTNLPPERLVVDPEPRRSHRVRLEGVGEQAMVYWRLLSSPALRTARATRLYELDTTFDYTPRAARIDAGAFAAAGEGESYESLARAVLDSAGQRQGYCVLLGCGEGRLAWEIARRSGLNVVCLDTDPGRVAAARRRLDRAGLYGVRVAVLEDPPEKPTLSDYVANLLVTEPALPAVPSGEPPAPAPEVFRLLRPRGGTAWISWPGEPAGAGSAGETPLPAAIESWLEPLGTRRPEVEVSIVPRPGGSWLRLRRGALPGSGQWTHQYGDAANSASSGDRRLRFPLGVLWFGRPGPRPMVDRGTRAPAPLAAGGRLFIQGDRRLFALDAYNGTILWTLEIPDLRRANVPRDSSNMAAAEDSLYVVVGDRCWRLDGATGRRLRAFAVPSWESAGGPYHWGYLACVGQRLYGGAVRAGGIYTGADGEWYDRPGEESQKVVSAALFALDRRSGDVLWVRSSGLAINSTIAAAAGRVYLIENRNPDARRLDAGRLGKEVATDNHLVALDAASGNVVYDRYYPFAEGRYVFYLTCVDDTLFALSTSDRYHAYAFDAGDGSLLWQRDYGFNRDHHGGAMQHPAVVGGVVYAEPKAFRLRTGDVVHEKLPERTGCGVLSASARCLFYRDAHHGMWDLEQDRRTWWAGLRSGCWLGLVPAEGLLLAPETSAGCYCANPVQTSLAFYPLGGE